MTTYVRIAIVAGAVLLALAELFVPEEDPRLGDRTTYGTGPMGFRAAYDLVAELGYPIRRHEAPIDRLATSETAWWLSPSGICPDYGFKTDAWPGGPWVLGGGTAVVWLPDPGPMTGGCALAALAVPARTPTRSTEPSGTDEREVPSRDPGITGLALFSDAAGWTPIVSHEGRPLVLEHAIGAGRVVLVASSRVVSNANLERADAAPLLLDLVERYGPPAVLEAPPPLAQASRSVSRYLAHSPAAIPLAGLVVTGLLLAWRGTLVPPRTLDDADVARPTLQHFVDGLARLYAGTRDYARILVRYRQLSASRLRRHLGLPAHASVDAIVARVGRMRTGSDDPQTLLDGPLRVTTAEELRAAVARLDALVAEVIG